MLSTHQQQQLNTLIQHYRLSHWLEVTDTGLRTKYMRPPRMQWKITALLAVLLFVIFLKVERLDGGMAWFWGAAGFFALGLLGHRYWHVEFDLLDNKVQSVIGSMVLLERDLSRFKGFGSEGGFVVNGVDGGGSLFMEFEGASKMRIAMLRNPDDYRNLQMVLFQALELVKQWQAL